MAVLHPIVTSAQELASKHITIREGLSSSSLYKVFEDSKGFIWLSTEYGLDRFDGRNFLHISTAEGLPGTPVISFFEDASGLLWFVTVNGKVCTWDGIRINNQPLGTDPLGHFVTCVTEDERGNIYLGINRGGIRKYSNKQLVKVFGFKEFYSANTPYDMISFNNEIFGVTFGGIFRMANEQLVETSLANKLGKLSRARLRLAQLGDNYVVGSEYGLFEVNKDTNLNVLSKYIPAGKYEIFDCLLTSDDRFWVATNDGILEFSSLYSQAKPARHLKGEKVSDLCQDKEGNVWATTLGNGAYFFPSKACINYTPENSKIAFEPLCLSGDGKDKVYVGDNSGNVYLIEGGKTQRFKAFNDKIYCRVLDITSLAGDDFIVATDLSLVIKEGRQLYINPYITAVKDILLKGDTVWCAGTPFGVQKSDLWSVKAKVKPIDINRKITGAKAILIYNDTLYFSTKDAVYKLGQTTVPLFPDVLKNYSLTSFVFTPGGDLWVGTNGDGLLVFNHKGLVRAYTAKDGLAGNFCEKIVVRHKDIYVATNGGVSKFTNNGNVATITNYTTANGILSNEINDIYVDAENNLWIATGAGLSKIDQNLLQQEQFTRPRIVIEDFIVNNHSQDRSIKVIPPGTREIGIKWAGIDFRNPEIHYKYRLKGIDTNWQVTTERQILYSSLGPGAYAFEVEAVNDNGSSVPVFFNFSIERAWWQESWSIALMIMLGLAAVTLGLYYLVCAGKEWQRKKEVEKRKVVEAEIRALRGQMNPHFLFNALNSIQHYILQQDKKSANEYLAKFAQLMRMVLENSKNLTISLADELKFLNLYLELEEMRFENRLKYEIRLQGFDDIDDIHVPSMIIQPIVENAIKHGISHKSGGGTVRVNFIKEKDFINCTISDDGVGRERAKQIAIMNANESTGTGITSTIERLNLLNKQKNIKAGMRIKDLLSNEGHSNGTLIELEIPLILS